MPPPAPAVYRELGGVPTPPNLRPSSRAGAAPGKGLPAARARSALAGRGTGVAGSSRFARVWGAPPAMDSGLGQRGGYGGVRFVPAQVGSSGRFCRIAPPPLPERTGHRPHLDSDSWADR